MNFSHYKKQNSLCKVILMFLFICGSTCFTFAQKKELKSTQDLSFLVGDWEIERVYRPKSETPRILKGTLSCELTMDNTFIKCVYEMQRPDKIRALDVVYFNYNSINQEYESLWLSSTWPVKVLMHGEIGKKEHGLILNTSAEFPIQNGLTEYVKGELVLTKNSEGVSFLRKTLIRTNKNDKWLHHMTETAVITK